MTFNEENTVENYVKDKLVSLGWNFVPRENLTRKENDVLVEDFLKEALINLNEEIDDDKAEEVLYKLRAIIISARGTGLVKTNEEFSKWLRNEKTMPFGEDGEHTTVKLIDYDNIKNNRFTITTQYSFKSEEVKRPDIALLVNGIPLVIGECKTPVRPAISWVDGAIQIEKYQKYVPSLFVPNVFCFATEGKEYRAGSIQLPVEKWQPWRESNEEPKENFKELENAINLMLNPETLLDILKNFNMYSTNKGGKKIKILCRYQQYYATNQIVKRVSEGKVKKGLIWHFQGSGKTFLMLYSAMQLRHKPELKSPTVIVVVDRVDLNSQMSANFNASGVPNTVIAESREELQNLLKQDTRKIIITTIHKFGEAEGVLNERENIIVLVDEAHRTQEGDLGKKMRESLPNAFLFGLTGTPINKRDRNTFYAFGADEDKEGYMNRYSFQQSLKDKATLSIYFEPRLPEVHIKKEEIDKGFDLMAEEEKLTQEEKTQLSKEAAKFAHIVKAKDRVEKICKDISDHYKKYIEPNNFKGQIVTYDRESCHLYKQELDKYLNPEETAVVMTIKQKGEEEWRKIYGLTNDEQEKLLDRFRKPDDPLKLLIVTEKLLTGFDAPINQVMYLDKPLKDHNLLQAICRVNRPYSQKDHGLIVDYIGVFDNVKKSLDFDIEEMQKVVSNINSLKKELPKAMKKCLSHFKNIDRSLEGYEGLLAAQEALETKEKRDEFAADYSYLNKHWEAISPDPILKDYEKDYKWLSQIYESLRPPSGTGKLVWHALGSKTLDLIHKNIDVQTIRNDLDTLIMDSTILENISEKDSKVKAKEIELKIKWKLHKHPDAPKFKQLGERLEKLKERHYKQAMSSIEFLKGMLDIAKDVVKTERENGIEPLDNTKEALTKIFIECKIDKTPAIVEQIVNDIDNVVKITRFDGWQWTTTGEKEIKKVLRQTLLKYKLHKEQELFDKAYNYIREHY